MSLVPRSRAVASKTPSVADVRRALRSRIKPRKAKDLARFFKTGPGQYGAGDRFLGVMVPDQRAVAKASRGLPWPGLVQLLQSPWHEDRLTGLLILVDRARRGTEAEARRARCFYRKNFDRVNNWDLVDLTAEHLLAPEVDPISPALLLRWARSSHLWRRRAAMVATFRFIRQGDPRPTLQVANILIRDPEDLIHKAVGWMLREVGKRCAKKDLTDFLSRHAAHMPRTMLRYALEHFPPAERAKWMGA